MSSGNALVLKPFDSAPVFVADENVILPGRTDPVTAYTTPGVSGEDLVFRVLVVLSRGLYRWSPTSGFSVIADDATPVPGGAGNFISITRYTTLSNGIMFSAVYSGGTGIFQYDDTGTIEPLVLPGDQTVGGETILSAFTPRGEGTLFSFRGVTAETAPWESVFARTADGLIYRVLGERDEIEGKTVLQVDGEADRDTVAVRIATLEDFEEIIYTADFGDAVSDIPVLSSAALAVLAGLLAIASLVMFRRVAVR